MLHFHRVFVANYVSIVPVKCLAEQNVKHGYWNVSWRL